MIFHNFDPFGLHLHSPLALITRHLRRQPAPPYLTVVTTSTVLLGLMALGRTAIKSPDVVFNKNHNEPWNDYRNRQYRLFGHDPTDCPAPFY